MSFLCTFQNGIQYGMNTRMENNHRCVDENGEGDDLYSLVPRPTGDGARSSPAPSAVGLRSRLGASLSRCHQVSTLASSIWL